LRRIASRPVRRPQVFPSSTHEAVETADVAVEGGWTLGPGRARGVADPLVSPLWAE
jgi:hypothetical protein